MAYEVTYRAIGNPETHKETIETDRRCQALNILYIRHIKNELPVKSDSPIKIECVTCVRN